jgi:HEAT repeat protein
LVASVLLLLAAKSTFAQGGTEDQLPGLVRTGHRLLADPVYFEPAAVAEILPPPNWVDERALPLLRELTKSGDGVVRAEATHTLGCLGNANDLVLLRLLTKDPTPHVAERAILAIGLLGDSAGIQVLSQILVGDEPRDDDPGLQRELALLALGFFKDGIGAAVINDHLNQISRRSFQRHRSEFEAVCMGLGLLPGQRGASTLLRLLDDASIRDGHVRAIALASLGRLGGAQAMPALAKALQEDRSELQIAAALALALLPPPGSNDFGQQLRRSMDRELRVAMARPATGTPTAAAIWITLAAWRDEAALPISRRTLANGPEALRPFAAMHIGRTGDASDRRQLQELLEAPMAPTTQAAVIEALATLGALSVRHRFTALLADRTTPTIVRAAAAEALARLKDEKALELIREAFWTTSDRRLLRALAIAARRLAPSAGIAKDPPYPDSTDPEAGTLFSKRLQALAAAGSRGLLGTILSALRDARQPTAVQVAALAALREYASPQCRVGCPLLDLPELPHRSDLSRRISSWFAHGDDDP